MKAIIRLACFASAVAFACAQPTQKSGALTSLSAADEAAIRAGSKTYEQGCNEKAWAKASSIFTDDAIFMPPHAPVVVGRAACEQFLRGFPAFKDLKLELSEIVGRGDLAVVRGSYSFVFTPANQPEQRDSGNHVNIWRRQAGGGWKLSRTIFTSDVAAPAGMTLAAATGAAPTEALRQGNALPARDVEAVRSAARAYVKAINDRAWSTAAGMFAEGGVIHAPNSRAVTGRANMEKWMQSYPPTRDLQVEPLEIDGHGDLAFVRGRYSILIMPPGQPEVRDVGKFIEIWRRQANGSWKLQSDTFNSDQPLVPSATRGAASAREQDVAAITAALQRAFDAAERGDERTFEAFSRAGDHVRLASVGSVPTLSKFKTDWREAVTRISRQVLADRETSVDFLSPDIATTTTRASYRSVNRAGVTSAAVPFAMTAVWQRQNGEWKIVNAHQSIQAEWPSADTVAATRGTDALLEGRWVLNVGRSRFNPGPAPKSETRTYSIARDGAQRVIYDLVDADGKAHRGESTFHPDGREAAINGLPDADMQTVRRTGPRSVAAEVKKGGKVVRTAVREISEDGRTLTVAFKGHNAAGQPLDDLWVFDRNDEEVAAAVKAAVADHWAAINRESGPDMDAVARRHTPDVTLIGTEWDQRVVINSPLGLALLKRFEGAKFQWTPRDVQVQVLNDTAAVAHFMMDGYLRTPEGAVDSRPRRVTEVWVKQGDTWKEAHHHDSVFTGPASARGTQ